MAWLTEQASTRGDYLAERSLIGRSPLCCIHVAHRSVSKEHAILAFEEDAWWIKDLGSRNGTWLSGIRLDPGTGVRVERMAQLRFGDVVMMMESAEPPRAFIRNEATRTCIVSDNGILSIPDEDRPLASVYESDGAQWELDVDGRIQPMCDGDTLYLAGSRYRFHAPGADAKTVTMQSTVATHATLTLSELELRFKVSRDEESITLHIMTAPLPTVVSPRASHQVLLLLARQRVEDRDRGIVESELGWLYTDDLAKMLGADIQKVNVDIHRLRQQFAKLGVLDAARVVERRPMSHQIRLGVSRVEIS